ncbi:hypothetical protein BH09BAC4_BH09BAC4_12170 [soil metagenome]
MLNYFKNFASSSYSNSLTTFNLVKFLICLITLIPSSRLAEAGRTLKFVRLNLRLILHNSLSFPYKPHT